MQTEQTEISHNGTNDNTTELNIANGCKSVKNEMLEKTGKDDDALSSLLLLLKSNNSTNDDIEVK
jgi:hypothetical protein